MLNPFFDKYIFTGGLKYQHHNFFLMKIPFALLPSTLLSFEKLANDSDFNKKFYYGVKESMIKSVRGEFGIDFKLEGEAGLLLFEQFFSASGFGLVSLGDLDKKNSRAIIVVNNSPIADALNGVNVPVDHFLRGVFAGVLTVFFDKQVDCVESDCAALNQQRCNFVIKENHEFDFSNQLVRQQIKVNE